MSFFTETVDRLLAAVEHERKLYQFYLRQRKNEFTPMPKPLLVYEKITNLLLAFKLQYPHITQTDCINLLDLFSQLPIGVRLKFSPIVDALLFAPYLKLLMGCEISDEFIRGVQQFIPLSFFGKYSAGKFIATSIAERSKFLLNLSKHPGEHGNNFRKFLLGLDEKDRTLFGNFILISIHRSSLLIPQFEKNSILRKCVLASTLNIKITDLPPEMLVAIACSSNFREVITLMQSNKVWHQALRNDPVLWHRFHVQYFPDNPSQDGVYSYDSFKQTYYELKHAKALALIEKLEQVKANVQEAQTPTTLESVRRYMLRVLKLLLETMRYNISNQTYLNLPVSQIVVDGIWEDVSALSLTMRWALAILSNQATVGSIRNRLMQQTFSANMANINFPKNVLEEVADLIKAYNNLGPAQDMRDEVKQSIKTHGWMEPAQTKPTHSERLRFFSMQREQATRSALEWEMLAFLCRQNGLPVPRVQDGIIHYEQNDQSRRYRK